MYMKLLISENKFRRTANKYVLNKLNSLKLSVEEEDDGIIRIDFDKTSKIDPTTGAFRYEDGILEVSSPILDFCRPFEGLKGFGDYKIIADWFELNYGAKVEQVWEWDDSGHP